MGEGCSSIKSESLRTYCSAVSGEEGIFCGELITLGSSSRHNSKEIFCIFCKNRITNWEKKIKSRIWSEHTGYRIKSQA